MSDQTSRPAAPADPPVAHYRTRACQVCGKGHAVTHHAYEQRGRLVSVAAHLRCMKRLRAGEARLSEHKR